MIHKLNKRTPLKDRVSVKFGDFLTILPTVPLVDPAPNYVYPMDENDQWGDCVCAGFDHFRQIVTGLLTGNQKNFTETELLDFYRTQNPNFDPTTPGVNDNGMNIQNFLEYLQAQKLIIGFASVDYTNPQELQAAIYIGLGLMSGVQIQNAQMTQFQTGKLWDTVVGSPVDGGHCVPPVGYFAQTGNYSFITWGKIQNATQAFITSQMDECWFVLTQEHIDHPEFRNHFDLAGFSQAVSEITNGKIVIPINPTLKMGSIGPSVVMLQNKLNSIMGSNLNPDGSFGTKTRAEVIAFQSKYKLFTDGICGKMTWIQIAHEIMHGLVEMAKCKDVMDTYRDNTNPDSPTGNFSEQWGLLSNFLNSMPTYKYFKASEIVGLKPELVSLLDKARGIAGVPFFITSGYRDPAHNIEVGGVSDSSHTDGLAVDLKFKDGVTAWKIITACQQVGFVRIGGYADGHIHVDCSKTLPQNVFWFK
jgi:peptidoglycan hydrolase-like protein with peptidoglycan-binding domain